ncbi:hypothetical protein [Actinomadura miaoliensis]|uniref:Helix-turn-helix domain-containing protein n=1 Tax=Actinomadura miaoliensis TaxID=430685 RepID=A0ABP7X5X1_9ACTN
MTSERLDEQEAAALRDAIEEAVLAAGAQVRDDDPDDHLRLVAAARVAAEETSRMLRQSINGARAAGHSWEDVGRVLGVSRQAAQQRFGTPARGASGATGVRKELRPVTAFNEMQALEAEGRRGWHSVDYGPFFHLVEASPHQWEHRRFWWPSRKRRRRMEEAGWQLITPSNFDSPWVYYKRPVDRPAGSSGDETTAGQARDLSRKTG